MTYPHYAFGGIKGVIMPQTKRGALLAIYGAPPRCNYCGVVGIARPEFGELNPNWSGNLWGGLTIDHIIPRCLNGASEIWNYQILCLACNQAKALIEQRVLEEEEVLSYAFQVKSSTKVYVCQASEDSETLGVSYA